MPPRDAEPPEDEGAERELPPGTEIRYFGDYELIEEIARGGMGVVYKARQVSLNRAVALKMILAGQLASEDDVKRFQTEAEAAANLQHPNIVSIHEVGQYEGQQYFSMDYVEGRTLADLVREHPLASRRAASYVKVIAEAIHYAHEQGTLHRDLKPSNVLIDSSDQVRITDFGLAKRVQSGPELTGTGQVLGTPSYMPPEQAGARHGAVGPRSDVYSVGAILYDLVTGRPPFVAQSPLDTLIQVRDSDPAAPRLLNPSIPRDLETICLKCLEKAPGRRYKTAKELAEDLQRFLNEEPVHARPASPVRRAAHWVECHPWSITAVAWLLILGLLYLTYGLWAQNRYLLWMDSEPEYVREPGPLTALVKRLVRISFCVFLPLLWTCSDYFRRSCGVTWKQYSDPTIPKSVGHRRVPRRLLVTYTILGGTGILYGLYSVVAQVDAYVWEQSVRLTALVLTYSVLYFASMSIWLVARESRSAVYGLPIETKKKAIRLQSGADWRAFSKTITVECALLGLFYLLIPLDTPLAVLAVVIFGWLLGFAFSLSARLKTGIRWKALCLLLVFLLAIVPAVIADIFALSGWPVAIGMALGAFASVPVNFKKVKTGDD